jgi:hypothetical protein
VSDVAWIGALPCALVTVAAIAWLGPPLGHLLFEPTGVHFWPNLLQSGAILPEPVEHGRYVFAVLGPLLGAGFVLAFAHHRALRDLPGGRVAVLASQLLLLAALAASVVIQHIAPGGPQELDPPRAYLTWRALALALAFPALALGLAHSQAIVGWVTRALRETRPRGLLAVAAAVLFTAIWLLPAVNTDRSIVLTNINVVANMPFWLDETFAVLNGRAPMVDFYARYSQLWPYVAGGVMSLLGTTIAVYSLLMASATGAAMLAVFAVFRRIVKRSLLALALYVPFVATSFFQIESPLAERWSPVNAFSMFPMRYAGPYVLAWLTTRHIDRLRPHRRSLLFLAGGIVAVNNMDFGIPALAATVAALLLTSGRPDRAGVLRLGRDLAAGVVGAVVLVCGLTLVVAGSLPHLHKLLLFPRLYTVEGWAMLPLPATIGLHTAIYLTFAAAIVVATVRAVRGEPDRVLTGMLVWAGVFGLGAAAYYVGRSARQVLVDVFSAWALALVLLGIVAVAAMRARRSLRPALGELAALVGLGVMVCSIAQTPLPWQQLERLDHRPLLQRIFVPTAEERFIARVTHRGERVGIFGPLGHRIAYDVGIRDVVPYATFEAIPTREQMREVIALLRRLRVTQVFLLTREATRDQLEAIEAGGYRPYFQTREVIALTPQPSPRRGS